MSNKNCKKKYHLNFRIKNDNDLKVVFNEDFHFLDRFKEQVSSYRTQTALSRAMR